MGQIEPLYTTEVTAIGARNGRVTSQDGVLDHTLKAPGGDGAADATNPEQLFAAGYAACFQGALYGAARKAKVDPAESEVKAAVSLGKEDSGAYGLSVTLTVRIPGVSRDTVQQIADAAHETCPYSRATRGNIDVSVIAAD